MISKNSKIDEYCRRTQELLHGKLCWGVEWSRLLNLTIQVGVPHLVPRRQTKMVQASIPDKRFPKTTCDIKGQYTLWFYHVLVQVRCGEVEIANEKSSNRRKWVASCLISGRRFLRISLDRDRDAIQFRFNNRMVVEVRPMKIKSEDVELWNVSSPSRYLFGVEGVVL